MEAGQPGHKLKCVLVVDDAPLVRRVASRVFSDAGHIVIEAENGVECLEILNTHSPPPDLIILDVMMPYKGGVETLNELREDRRFRITPVIMLTGESDMAIIQEVFDKGVTDYILKEDMEEVVRRLSKHLKLLSQTRKCVLVVDDTTLIRRLVSREIKAAGHLSLEAKDGIEAMDIVELGDPDLIIMDINMPKRNGIETLQELRKNVRHKTTPVIMLTGDGDTETVKQIVAEGIVDYILKDDLEAVTAKLREHLVAR
jgi:CheY-like chemotaxis protein